MSDRQSTHETLPSEWQVIDLSAMIAPESSITYGVVQPGQEVVDGIPFVRGGDIYGGKIAVHKLRTISSSISSAYRRTLLRGGELLMSLVGYPGEVAVVPNGLAGANIARQAALIRLDRIHDAKYVMYFLLSDLGKQRIFEQSNGSAQQVVNLADLKHVRVTLPPLPQQRKIAQILTTVDNLIEKTEALIAKYQAIKQGMMHDLFTRGVDEHGHLRPPYEEAPELYKTSELGWIPMEWEATDLGSLCDTASGGTPSRDVAAFWNGTIPWVKTGEVNYRVIVETEEQITQLGMAGSAARLLPKGTVIMALFGQGPTRGRVGILGIDATVNQACLAFLPSQKIATEYLYYTLMWSYDDLRMLSNDGAQQNLNASLVRGFTIPVPDTSEQGRIALRVKIIEDSANAEHRHLDKLWESKTGLMQDLLTGKVRVKADETEEAVRV